MIRRCSICLFVLFLVLLVTVAVAEPVRTEKKSVPDDPGIEQVYFKADLDAADVRVSAKRTGAILEADIRYDPDEHSADLDYEKFGKSCDIFLNSDKLKSFHGMDTDKNRWHISLSPDKEWDIEWECGASDSRFDLTGIPITRFELDVGASDCDVTFAEKNPVTMRECAVDAGVGDIELTGLGFADFEHLAFDGGIGDVLIDLSGFGGHYATVDIEIGIGAVHVRIPNDVPVRIEAGDGLLNSIDFTGNWKLEPRGGVYTSDDFERGRHGLDIRVEVGLGEAEIELID